MRRSATRRAPTGPTCPARSSSATAANCAARCGGLEREGFRKVHVLRGAEEVDARRSRHREALQRPDPPHRPLRHHRRHPRLLAPSWSRCSAELGYDGRRAPRRPHRRLRRRPGRPRPGQPRGAAPRDGAWSRPGNALCVPGNHENKLGRYLKGRNVQHTHGLAETIEQLDGGGATSSAREVRDVHRRAGQPLRPGRRQARRLPRRACRRSTTAAPPAGSARTRSTATPPARPTSSACPCATRGRRTTGAAPRSSTATRPFRARPGSTTPSAWTPAPSSAAS